MTHDDARAIPIGAPTPIVTAVMTTPEAQAIAGPNNFSLNTELTC